jgi:hypothetical protein
VRLYVELVHFDKGIAVSVVKCSGDLPQNTVGCHGCFVALPGGLETASHLDSNVSFLLSGLQDPWMKEVKGIRHRGRGVYLRCPVFTTVQFSLRNEGSSEYICLCEGREILSPNFQTFQDPRHQFHGIGRLVSETLYLFATLALLHIQAELILGTFLPSLKV